MNIQRSGSQPWAKGPEDWFTGTARIDPLFPASSPASAASIAANLSRLAALIGAYAPHDGRFELRIPGVYAIRRSNANRETMHGVQQAAFCIVAQGAKSIIVGSDYYQYDAEHIIVFSVDVPVASQVTRASEDEPFLCLRLDLDANKIAELVLKVFPHGLPPIPDKRAVSVTDTDVNILNAATRLVELTAHAGDVELLAPLVIDEMLIRLLRGPAGPKLAQMGLADSGVHGVAKAVSWLQANFSQPVKVESLAALANMSASAFHQHFKLVTSMTPLQYQKALRLQEARRLMLSSMMDAAVASHRVGYQSPSQFSREYGRFFGCPPATDIAKLRDAAVAGEVE